MTNTKNQIQRPWLNTLMGSRIRIRTPGSETDYSVTVIEYVEPGNSPPPIFTRHEFVEVFCVIDGTLTFQFQDETKFTISAGESVTCPGFKPHSFWNETDNPVTALLICTPAGLDQFFIESDELLKTIGKDSDKASEASYQLAMKALRDKYGLEHVGSPPAR